jgi:hypothetical protein
MSDAANRGDNTVTPLEAQRMDPEHATSELAPETPPQDDAEQLEDALREAGRPLVEDVDDPEQQAKREAPIDRGGTSLS